MIYIYSAHLGDEWKQIQSEYISKYTSEPYKLVQYTVPNRCPHIRALGRVLEQISLIKKSKKSLMVIMDSDAFPINSDWINITRSQLDLGNEFVAVQRLENPWAFNKIAHSCYVAWYSETLMEFKSISECPYVKGWKEKRWGKVRRSNAVDLHKQLYGIYGDMIYHMGCGSRLEVVKKEKFFKDGLHYFNVFWRDPKSFIEKLRGKAI